MVAPESVILNARKIIETNPASMSTVLTGFNDKSKQKILDGLDYSKLKKEDDVNGTVVEVGGRKVLVNPKTGATIKDLGSSADPSAGGGIYTEKQLKALTKLNEDVSGNQTYKKTASMRNFGDNVLASLGMKTGVGDVAAINQFQKVIDEGAVTREQDVVLIQNAQSLANRLALKIEQLKKGDQLSQTQREQMATLVSQMYDNQVKALMKDPYMTAKSREAELYGLTLGDTILSGLGDFSKGEELDSMRAQLQSGEMLVSREGKDGRYYVAITPDELWATDIKL